MQIKFFNTLSSDEDTVSILLYGDIEEASSKTVVEELITLQNKYPKINVRINSNGGSVFAGMAIYNALKTSKADITLFIDGVAASIAGVIALCGKPLYMAPFSKLMLHSVTDGAYGNVSQLEQTTALMKELQNDLAQMIATRLGTDAKEVQTRFFDEKDHWIKANEALEMKLINGIYEVALSDTPKEGEDVYTFFNNRLNSIQRNKTKIHILDHLQELKDKANKWDEYIKENSIYNQKIKELEVLGDLTPSEKVLYKDIAENNPNYFNKLIEVKKNEFINIAKVNYEETVKRYNLGRRFNNIEVLKNFALTQPLIFKELFTKGWFMRASEVWTGGNYEFDRSNWTLDDYRKNDPSFLERNPDIFHQLLKIEQKKETTKQRNNNY